MQHEHLSSDSCGPRAPRDAGGCDAGPYGTNPRHADFLTWHQAPQETVDLVPEVRTTHAGLAVASRHGRSACHSRVGARVGIVMVALATSLACATVSGWARSDSRVCRPDAAPRLCVAADPDRSVRVAVGGVTLLPGECATAPSAARGGRLRIDIQGESRRVGVPVRTGAVTVVVVHDAGTEPTVIRDPCEGPVADPSPAGRRGSDVWTLAIASTGQTPG